MALPFSLPFSLPFLCLFFAFHLQIDINTTPARPDSLARSYRYIGGNPSTSHLAPPSPVISPHRHSASVSIHGTASVLGSRKAHSRRWPNSCPSSVQSTPTHPPFCTNSLPRDPPSMRISHQGSVVSISSSTLRLRHPDLNSSHDQARLPDPVLLDTSEPWLQAGNE